MFDGDQCRTVVVIHHGPEVINSVREGRLGHYQTPHTCVGLKQYTELHVYQFIELFHCYQERTVE